MDSALKYQIAEKIIQSNDDSILHQIKELLDSAGHDFWADLPNEVKYAITKAKDQLDKGEGLAHSQVMTEIKRRFLSK